MINNLFKQHYRKLLTFFAVLLVLSSCTSAARSISSSSLGRAADPVPFMASARTGVLPSGMRYILLENTRPEGRAFLTLAVDAGSILETEYERGLAHFVEHMAFNGTARFPRMELINYLRSLGMRFGPDFNAWVSFDETVYGIEVPVEIRPDGRRVVPDMALAIIEDWSHSITFHPEDVESERLVIIEEYRFRLGARDRINREMFPVLFRDSLYAERLPIGVLSVIENAQPETLEAFYRRWYRPENMALIIVGDFDAAYLEASLAEHFPGPLDERATEPFVRPRFDLREPERGSLKTLVLTDDELVSSRVDLYWKRTPQPPRQDLAFFRERIIDNLIQTMLSLRFQEEQARPETPYVWAGGGMSNWGYSSRFYILAAQAKTGLTRETLEELLLTKETLSRHGFTQSEVDTAKAAMIANLEQRAEERYNQHSNVFINAFTRHFLNGRIVPDITWELEAARKLLPGISLREINRTVRSYFAENDLTVVITTPEVERDSLPNDAEIRTMVAEARRARIARPVRVAPQGELLAQRPQPGEIVSEIVDSETGAIRMRLSNGAEVILKETQNRAAEISFHAQARGGTLSASDETAVSVALAAEMLNVSGLGPFSLPELTRMLLDRQVSFSFWTQPQLRGFQGSSSVRDIQTLFEMIHLSFTQPRFDPEAIEAMLDQRRSTMAFQENDPNMVFRREITRTTHGNPRFHPLVLSDLDRVNPDDAMAFIRRSLNPADYSFVFVGNVDLPVFRPLIKTYLASIPLSEAFNEWTYIDPRRPSNVEREIHRGREERSLVYLGWFAPHIFSEEKGAAVSVLNEYLSIKLIDEIREALGGVYSISSWVSITPIPTGELSGGVFFVCSPRRAEELIAAVKEEFNKITRGEIDAVSLEKAIEALIQNQGESVQRNNFIAMSYSNSATIFRSPLSRLDRRPGLVRNVVAADIQQTARELLGGSFVQLVLFPEDHR